MTIENQKLNNTLEETQKRQDKEAKKIVDRVNRQEEELRRAVQQKQEEMEKKQRQGARAYLLRKAKEAKAKKENMQKQAQGYLKRRLQLEEKKEKPLSNSAIDLLLIKRLREKNSSK